MKIIKILNKEYNQLTTAVKASLWYMICNILQKGISFITIPIFTRLLSQEEYGQVSVFNAWHDILFVFASLSLFFAAYNNAMVKFKHDIDRYTSSMLLLSNSCTLFCGMVCFIIKFAFPNSIQLSSGLLLLMFGEFLFTPAINFWMVRCRFQFRYQSVICISLIISVFSPLLAIAGILIFDNKVLVRIITFSFVQICIGGVIYFLLLTKGRTLYVKQYWKYALGFSIPLIPHHLSGIVLSQADRIMIESFSGSDKAAIYSLAYNASYIGMIIITAISSSLTPWIYHRLEEKEYIKINASANKILMGLASILLIFELLVPEIIKILATPEYLEALYILPPLVMSVFFYFAYGLFGSVELFFEEKNYMMLASVIAAILNVVLNYIFIPIYGYFFAAYTTLFCYVILTVSHYIFMRIVLKKHNVKTSIYNSGCFYISVIFILLSCFFLLIYNIVIIRYVIVIGTLVFMGPNRNKIIKYFKEGVIK